MKKKQGKKKNLTKKKKISENNAFKNIEREIPAVTLKSKKPNGIEAFESLPNTYYKTQAERLYRDLFEPEKFWYKEILLTAMFEVLFLSYGLYAYDLYLDIDLINAYQIQENNLRNLTLSTKNDSNFTEQSMEGV